MVVKRAILASKCDLAVEKRPRPSSSTTRRRPSLRRTPTNTCALPGGARVRPLSSTTPQTPNAGVEERLISRRRTTTSNDQRRRDLETRLTVVNDRAAFPISRRQEATTRSVRTVHHCRRQVAMVHRRRHHHHPPPTIHYHHRHPLRSRPTSNPPPHHHTSLTHTRPPITPPLHPTPESFFWVTSTPPTSKFSPPPWAPPLRRWRPCFARPGTLVDKGRHLAALLTTLIVISLSRIFVSCDDFLPQYRQKSTKFRGCAALHKGFPIANTGVFPIAETQHRKRSTPISVGHTMALSGLTGGQSPPIARV